jgi:hypothetical protein
MLAALSGLSYWLWRPRKRKPIDLQALGKVSDQWFSDHRNDL